MKNNKGFAISLMLYAMILLIVTIFYIVLAIVKTRFTYSEAMVNGAVEFLDLHDTSLGHGDRTGPLVVFDPSSSGFNVNSGGIVTVNIFDDNDGEGLDPTSIKINIKTGNSMHTYYNAGNISGNYVYDVETKTKGGRIIQFKCSVRIPKQDNSYVIYVSAKDKKGNFTQTLPRYTDENNITYSYQKYVVTDIGPICEINGPKLVSYNENGLISGTTNITNGEVDSNSSLLYEIICTGENGIDAYLVRNDFKYTIDSSNPTGPQNDKNSHIYVNNVIVENGINAVKVSIYATAFYVPASTTNPWGCTSEGLSLELKEGFNIKDSIGNLACKKNPNGGGCLGTLNFNDNKVRICLRQSANINN